MATDEAKWTKKYLSVLDGATIIGTKVNVQNDFGYAEVWPVLVVKTKDGETLEIEVSQDPEGNGPGFLFGLPEVS